MLLEITSVQEDQPGEKWQGLFHKFWPAYRRWFFSEGNLARPGYTTAYYQFKQFMPELVPVYERLVELAGGGDGEARFLSMYGPPPYLNGCSQVVLSQPRPFLLRNYDYSPRLFEGVVLRTHWLRPVIALSDCCWGVLDGVNDAGLVVSLAFGGRKLTGPGFGIPLLLRYVLETCEDVPQAVDALERVPIHMPYNVSLIDRSGDHRTAYLSPRHQAVFVDQRCVTNHQERIEWEDYALRTHTQERLATLRKALDRGLNQPEQWLPFFFQLPLHQTDYGKGFGTLYTALYDARAASLQLTWPNHKELEFSFEEFPEETHYINLNRFKSKLSL